VSPRRADPALRESLIETAALLLAEEGPAALSTRRLAAQVGTSTTAVYTHFGGMDDLVRAVVHEGFARLNARMGEVGRSPDPVADVAALGLAYRRNAQDNPALYAVMFGGAGLGGFSMTDEDRQYGRFTLEILVGAIERCVEAGRFRPGDSPAIAHQMWIALHGLVSLELGGYLVEPYDADACFAAQVRGLIIGAGDDPASAARSTGGDRAEVARSTAD
jgi:AcrR family transcriptional regulator